MEMVITEQAPTEPSPQFLVRVTRLWDWTVQNFNPLSFSFAVIGFSASAITILTSVLPVYRAPNRPDWFFVAEFLIWISAVFIVVASVFCGLFLHRSKSLRWYKRMQEQREDFDTIVARDLEYISAKCSDTIDKLVNCLNEHQSAMAQGAESRVHEDMGFVINNIQSLFTHVTGHKCAVSIKILFFSETQKIYTYRRDSHSMHDRGRIDRLMHEYPYTDNTAYETILDPEKPNAFISNNLKSLDGYKNTDPDWNKYYNATAVVPITKAYGNESEDTLGFICVDNLLGGFSEEYTRRLLMEISYSMYNIFRLLCYIKVTAHVPRRDIDET